MTRANPQTGRIVALIMVAGAASGAGAQSLRFTFADAGGVATDQLSVEARGQYTDVPVYLMVAPDETVVRPSGLVGFGVRVIYPQNVRVNATSEVFVNPAFNGIKSIRLINGGVNVVGSTLGQGVMVDASGRILLATIRFTGGCTGPGLLVTADPSANAHMVTVSGITVDSQIANTSAIITVGGTPCIADFNCSADVTVQDLFDFLAQWFAGNASADVNSVGGVTVQDIFDFLSSWFQGC